MNTLVSMIEIVRTARDTAAAARNDWFGKETGGDDWQTARSLYLAAEDKQTTATRQLLRIVKVLAGTDTLYLYLNFPVLTEDQRSLLNVIVRENQHEQLLDTEQMPGPGFVTLAPRLESRERQVLNGAGTVRYSPTP